MNTTDKTAAERQQRRRQKLTAAGLVQKSFYCHPDDWPAIQNLIDKLTSKRATPPASEPRAKRKPAKKKAATRSPASDKKADSEINLWIE